MEYEHLPRSLMEYFLTPTLKLAGSGLGIHEKKKAKK